MANKIIVIYKKVGQRPVVTEVEDDYKAYQGLVGGLFEFLRIDGTLILGMNEDGRMKKLPVNLKLDFNKTVSIHNNEIVGDVFITAEQGPDFRSLTEKEQVKAMAFLEEWGVAHRNVV